MNSSPTWIQRISQLISGEPRNREEIVDILRDATENELLEPNTLSMLEGVLDVHEARVKDVMVPRSQMVTLNNDFKLEDIVKVAVESGHSRFPIVGEDKDQVLGILLSKDLLSYGFSVETIPFSIKDILRPAVFVPESKRLDILLHEFRINRNHMAIVVDEYGGITGLVTIEDVLEQIVGDIDDEYDTIDTPLFNKQQDGSYNIKALTSIEDFNEYFKTDIDDKEVETIGGLVLRAIKHMPKRGEYIDTNGFIFTVLRADNRRIYLVNVSPSRTKKDV